MKKTYPPKTSFIQANRYIYSPFLNSQNFIAVFTRTHFRY